MFDLDGTNLVEGIEIKGEEIGLIEIYKYYDCENMELEELEKLIGSNI